MIRPPCESSVGRSNRSTVDRVGVSLHARLPSVCTARISCSGVQTSTDVSCNQDKFCFTRSQKAGTGRLPQNYSSLIVFSPSWALPLDRPPLPNGSPSSDTSSLHATSQSGPVGPVPPGHEGYKESAHELGVLVESVQGGTPLAPPNPLVTPLSSQLPGRPLVRLPLSPSSPSLAPSSRPLHSKPLTILASSGWDFYLRRSRAPCQSESTGAERPSWMNLFMKEADAASRSSAGTRSH